MNRDLFDTEDWRSEQSFPPDRRKTHRRSSNLQRSLGLGYGGTRDSEGCSPRSVISHRVPQDNPIPAPTMRVGEERGRTIPEKPRWEGKTKENPRDYLTREERGRMSGHSPYRSHPVRGRHGSRTPKLPTPTRGATPPFRSSRWGRRCSMRRL